MSWKTDVRQYCPKKSDRILATTVSIYCAFSVPGTVCLSCPIFELAFLIITNLSGSLLLASFPQEKKFRYLFRVAQVIIGQDSNLGLSDFQTRALNPSVILPWKGCFRHVCGQKSDYMGPWRETAVKKNEKKAIC